MALSLGGVGGDCIEDVDQHQEQGDQEAHSPRDDVHGDEKWDPGYDHKQTCRQKLVVFVIILLLDDDTTWGKVVGDDVGGHVTSQDHLEPGNGEVAKRAEVQKLIRGLQWQDV